MVLGMFVWTVLVVLTMIYATISRRGVVYVCPMWGIGNRLRTLRKGYAVATALGKEFVIVERDDAFFAKTSMGDLWNLPFRHVSMSWFNDVHRTSTHTLIPHKCELHTSLTELKPHKNIFIKACDINCEGISKDAHSLYDVIRHDVDPRFKGVVSKVLENRHRIVGVHVRQGSKTDWKRGYFFSDEWDGISKREPSSAPNFCCFEDASKNLSACPSKITYVEAFVEEMRKLPEDTIFFVCSDRPGCHMYIEQTFPKRVLRIPSPDTESMDVFRDYADFHCLSLCSHIIVSRISSFADEARRPHDVPVTKLEK